MTKEIDWIDLLADSVSREEGWPLISKGIEDLDNFLKRDPSTEQRVVDILGRMLSGEITEKTWDVMHSSLSQYFTEDLAYLLYWAARVEDPKANRLVEIERYASSEVMAFLRAIVGIYGADITKAFNIATMNPNNWRTVYRDLYYDLMKGRYLFKISILKYNEEEMSFEGPPDSILELICKLIHTVRFIETKDVFSEGIINQYLEESEQLTALLQGKLEEETEPVE